MKTFRWKKPKSTKKTNKSSTNPNTPDVIAYYTKLMEELPEELENRDVLVLKYKEYIKELKRRGG